MAGLFAAMLAFTVGALAQDDDDDLDDLDDDVDIGTPAPKPPSAEPEPAEPDNGDEDDQGLDDFRDADDGTDLLEGEPQGTPGADTELVYRAANAKLAKLEPDEELAGWEAYLEQYPQSAFRKRIEARMEELTDLIYEGGPTTSGPAVDAMDQEIMFSQAMLLENIDPRTRLQAGFEWGLPDFISFVADYEHQLVRPISIHAGVRHRYLGWSVELGGRFALVKSTRTKTLVTLITDFRVNTLPAYPALRPQLAFGKRFGKLDAQLQGGADVEYRVYPDALGGTVHTLQPSVVGGASMYYAASDQVGLFVETSLYMRPVSADGAFEGGLFRFNVVDFGMKFYPGKKRNIEVNFGATVPYMQEWWQFHYGSVLGQLNYYL